MWDAVGQVTSWPTGDQFARYVPYQGPPTVPPTVAVTSPNGGEKLTAGAPGTVSWDASDDHAVYQFDVALSTDGGATYPVVLAAGLDGSARSAVLALPRTVKGKKARIRVVARDADGNETADASDANFRIKKAR
jgi:Big-like domain-containing protein